MMNLSDGRKEFNPQRNRNDKKKVKDVVGAAIHHYDTESDDKGTDGLRKLE